MRETSIELDKMMPLILERLAEGGCVSFTPQGTSMLPTIKGGVDQVVLTGLPDKLNKYDIPLYRRDNGHYVLHRIAAVDRERDEYTMIGDNQFTYEPGIRRDQLLAIVTAVIKDGRERPVIRLSARVYSRLWHYSRPMRHFWLRARGYLRRLIKG